jgi:hypothetical protein
MEKMQQNIPHNANQVIADKLHTAVESPDNSWKEEESTGKALRDMETEFCHNWICLTLHKIH